jgi:hypothetical protein
VTGGGDVIKDEGGLVARGRALDPHSDAAKITILAAQAPAARIPGVPDDYTSRPRRSRPAARFVALAVIAVVGGVLALVWWQFIAEAVAYPEDRTNLARFLFRVCATSAYLWVSWRVWRRLRA